MTISGFICTLNPEEWCFPYLEALRSYLDMFDEVIVVDGGSTDGSLNKIQALSSSIEIVTLDWPWNYGQREFARHYNFGFEQCTGDWAFKLDCDWLFHETDMAEFRTVLQGYNSNPSVAVVRQPKLTMLNRQKYHHKGKMTNGIHMRYWRDRLRCGVVRGKEGECDWTNIVQNFEERDGVYYGELLPEGLHARLPTTIYNYDCFFRTREKCRVWYERSARAYFKDTGHMTYGDPENSWVAWCDMMRARREATQSRVLKVNNHPKYIQDRLNSMTPDMWGWNNWEWKL